MKPPSNDADRPNAGQAPGAGKDGPTNPNAPPSQAGKPGTPATPQGRPSDTLPPGVHVKSEPGKLEAAKPDVAKSDAAKTDGGKSDAAKPEPAKPVAGVAPPSPAQASRPEAGRTDPPISAGPKVEPGRPAQPSATPPDPAKTEAKPAGTAAANPAGTPATEPAKPGLSGAPAGSPAAKDPGKPEFGRPGATAEPPKPAGGPAQGAPRPTGALTDGPIIDLKAKRVEDSNKKPDAKGDVRGDAKAAAAGAAGLAAAGAVGLAASDGKANDGKVADGRIADGKISDAKAGAKPAGSGSAPPRVGPSEAPAARGPGFGSVATAGLLGGVIGAGLLFAVERAGILGNAGDDARLNALDQRISGQFTGLDQRMASLSPRDAVAALDKRVAANETTLKPLPDAVKAADATAKQALDRAAAAPGAPATGGASPAPTALPADIAARLDSLDQRVSALQEEPGRDQPADSRLGATQAGDGAQQIAALDGRVKALEDKAPDKAARAPAADLAPKLAALQGEVETRTRANAEAGQALGQRLDALQKALDERVKAATEAVQTATQASREAAEAGRSTAEAATKALDRRLQEQAEKVAALDKAVALRAEASTVQAALKVVTADRIAAALDAGVPYAEPLATLRKLETGDASRIDALAPFSDKGAPTADQLAATFRPIADKASAARKAAASKDVAANGDLKSRFLSIADSIVQVRKVDAPPAADAADADPAAKVQAALDRGALTEASQAYAAMPQDLKAQAGGFGATLTQRAAAAQAARALLSDAFKGLPTAAPAAKP